MQTTGARTFVRVSLPVSSHPIATVACEKNAAVSLCACIVEYFPEPVASTELNIKGNWAFLSVGVRSRPPLSHDPAFRSLLFIHKSTSGRFPNNLKEWNGQ